MDGPPPGLGHPNAPTPRFGKPAGERPRRRPHDIPRRLVRAQLFCTEHGKENWRLLAVVADEPAEAGAERKSALVTTDEDVPYPDTTREVRATCATCAKRDRGLGLRYIDNNRLRTAVEAGRSLGRVEKIDIDLVCRRGSGR